MFFNVVLKETLLWTPASEIKYDHVVVQGTELWKHRLAVFGQARGGILALRTHCALLLDYFPPEEPLGTPLGNTLRFRRPKLDWRGP